MTASDRPRAVRASATAGTDTVKDRRIYRVPALTSVYPSRRHPGHQAVRADDARFVVTVLNPLARAEYDEVRGDYVHVGADYMCEIFPSGQVDRLKLLSRFSSSWAFVDDLMDDSVDADHIETLLGACAEAVLGRSVAGPEFRPFADVFAPRGWAPGAHQLCVEEMLAWIASVRAMRSAEIGHEVLSVARYLDLRSRNDAVQAVHSLAGYAMPELAPQLYAAAGTDGYRQAVRHSAAAVGIALDLSMVNAERAEITEWAHIVPVVERSQGPGRQRAIDTAVALFHQHEQRLGAHLTELRATHPAVAEAVRACHGGNMGWIARSRKRGLRYAES
ncbi:hypothetical protein ABTX81_01385 [Kitasatospora sp. NPDC097605]|uniref:terpene synthase family protein n=1 Tax=Kitasatospora sp. NPDC097605 TaxID=3157226 RepID=UPI0033238CE9